MLLQLQYICLSLFWSIRLTIHSRWSLYQSLVLMDVSFCSSLWKQFFCPLVRFACLIIRKHSNVIRCFLAQLLRKYSWDNLALFGLK